MTISARLVDITTLAVDAIVNAANTRIGARRRRLRGDPSQGRAGLARACLPLAPCPAGQARLTPGFDLPARFVIHAVGPVWQGGAAGEAELLASAYRASLALAMKERLRSIAFPAVSTGIYGYPLAEATAIAVATVRQALASRSSIEEVIFACFSPKILSVYQKELHHGREVVSDLP